MEMVDNSFMCTAVVSQSAWWLNRIEAILNDLSGEQSNRNNGKSSSTPKHKKGVVSLEKDMKENHIFLGGNDPFLRLDNLEFKFWRFLPINESERPKSGCPERKHSYQLDKSKSDSKMG